VSHVLRIVTANLANSAISFYNTNAKHFAQRMISVLFLLITYVKKKTFVDLYLGYQQKCVECI